METPTKTVSKWNSQSNILTQSKQDFKVIEKRCIYFMIHEVRRLYVDSNEGQRDLFNDMYLQIKGSKLQGEKLADEVKDVYKALRDLKGKNIEIENDDEWILTSFVLQAKHNKKTDIYTIQVSADVLPLLVDLAEKFTTYDLTVAISLKSTYSQRMYEFCCQYRKKKKFFLTIEDLREKLKLENKYQNVAHLKQKVLDVAQREIKELYEKGQCELYFDYAVKDKDKRKILSYWFFIHTKEAEEKTDYGSAIVATRRMYEILRRFFKRDEKYIERVINALEVRPDIACPAVEKIQKRLTDYDLKSGAPIIRYILKEDFQIR